MAYTQPWALTVPAGTDPANQLDTYIKNFKTAVGERLDDIFGTSAGSAITTADPYRPKVLKLTGDAASKILVGSTSLTFRDSGDTTDILTVAGNKNITLHSGNAANTIYDAGNITGAVTINWNNGNNQKATLTGNVTFTFSNPKVGGFYTLQLTQDGTGSRTATWPATAHFPTGLSDDLTTTAGRIDLLTFYYNGSIYISGFSFRNIAP